MVGIIPYLPIPWLYIFARDVVEIDLNMECLTNLKRV